MQIRFQVCDLADDLPRPGFYHSTILCAELRRSHSGNHMVRVVHALDGVPVAHDRVWDYFVLSGASPRGVAMARRRLVQLHRACGFSPREDEPISLAELEGARVEVKVEHTTFEGERRLRVVAYRPALPAEPSAEDRERSAS
jgi:hypothetical protein